MSYDRSYDDPVNPPPAELWIGKERSRWMIHAFGSEAQVKSWLEREEQEYPRRVWRVEGFDLTEVELEPPAPPRGLRPKTRAADA